MTATATLNANLGANLGATLATASQSAVTATAASLPPGALPLQAANDARSSRQPAADADVAPLLKRGLAILVLGLGGFLGFAAWAPVDQALPGNGLVSVAGQRKAVQHPAGGRVARLAVHEGDVVRQGQVLLTLDVDTAKAELTSVQRQSLLLAASRERLAALLAGERSLVFSPALQQQAFAQDRGKALLATQAQLFNSQRQGRDQGDQQLGARHAQLQSELAGHNQMLQQREAQRQLVEDQVKQLDDLTRQGFYPRIRLADAQRQLMAAQQESQQSSTDIQRTRQALAEAGHAQALRGSEQRRDWESELLEAERQAALLEARAAQLQQQIGQADITAPVAGSVVGLVAHTVGGVVQPGQTLMELVPQDEALVVDARFDLTAGEKLQAGQRADLHFNTMDRGRTPVLQGQVLTVSADRLEDSRSGQPYLRVRVAVPAAERDRLRASGTDLRAGLPVEVMVQLGERTLLAYLLNPLTERFGRAFTE